LQIEVENEIYCRQSEITVAGDEGPAPALFETYDAPRASSTSYRTSQTNSGGGGYPYVQHLDQSSSIVWNGEYLPGVVSWKDVLKAELS
jgi:hypothetical protein